MMPQPPRTCVKNTQNSPVSPPVPPLSLSKIRNQSVIDPSWVDLYLLSYIVGSAMLLPSPRGGWCAIRAVPRFSSARHALGNVSFFSQPGPPVLEIPCTFLNSFLFNSRLLPPASIMKFCLNTSFLRAGSLFLISIASYHPFATAPNEVFPKLQIDLFLATSPTPRYGSLSPIPGTS